MRLAEAVYQRGEEFGEPSGAEMQCYRSSCVHMIYYQTDLMWSSSLGTTIHCDSTIFVDTYTCVCVYIFFGV